jgi:UDP-N-acetylmuramate dehydrogenase
VNRQQFEARIAARLKPDQIQRDAPLAPLTTFKVGGPADWLIDVQTADELMDIVTTAADSTVPITVLGGGSNVLIGDRGIRGAVLRLRLTGISSTSARTVRAECGVTINGLVRWTIGRGAAGLEAWAGTPGTVGGAVYGNAHYGGRNIGDLIAGVRLVTFDGSAVDARGEELHFGYDTSRLKRTREILVWADFNVHDGRPDDLRATARASLAHRKRTQPLDTPSAGCIFQNPDPSQGDVVPAGIPASAGALIDRAGLRDKRIGGARISPTHANFFLNDGAATASDIRQLIDLAREEVKRQFGVELRDEIIMLGEFDREGHF